MAGFREARGDLQLESVTKSFGDFVAVDGIDLTVPRGSFFALLGPSGCGKTTTLRMIAGFESISSGDLMIRGRRINDLAPEQRPTSMIFQNYALFPHMTVRQNVRFGLRMATQGIVMESGRVLLDGRANDVLNNPEMADLYFGGSVKSAVRA